MKQFFLVSRYSDDIYNYIVNQCYLDIKKTDKNNIKIKKIELRRYPDFKFLFYCFFCLLKGDFFKKEKIVLLKYQNINFGKHLLSFTFRNYRSYISPFIFYYVLIKNIYIISKYFKTADYYIKNLNFKYVYLDHLEYLNGIFYRKFVKNNKKIYSNRFPRSIIKTKEKNIEKLFEIEFKPKIYTKKGLDKLAKSSKKIFTSIRDYLPWLYHTKFYSFKIKNLKKYDYIIYAHSFTDGQLEHPYDGFVNTLEWLKFTVSELKKKKNIKFIIKAHPNFYMKSKVKGITEIADWDKKIYEKFFKNIDDDQDILIINKPVLNYDIAKKLDKKCIVITKHGSVQLEMIYHNFKVITSKSNFINPKYSLTNMWDNKHKYKDLLNKNWDELKFAKKEKFYSVIENLFLDEIKVFGRNHYLNILKKFMVRARLIKKNSSYEEMIIKFKNLKDKNKIIENINFPIITI